MQKQDFHYHLPSELIARYPLAERSASRLLVMGEEGPSDREFTDLTGLLRDGDLLVLNDTRVIPARLFGQKPSGGKVEVLIERINSPSSALVLLKASKKPKPGTPLIFDAGYHCVVKGREDNLFEVDFAPLQVLDVLNDIGHVPLPPYIDRADEASDFERYQTVFADQPGAVAAPTAGLHFDQGLLDDLRRQGVNQATVTLHVGSGTFLPIRTDNLDEHVMHREWLTVDAEVVKQINATKARGGRIVAVGTTVVRALETAALSGSLQAYDGDTRLFIRPGFDFRVVDALVTNFHLPESTLLMLVCAFGGYRQLMEAYQHAVRQQYRFFSYGDAMFIPRSQSSQS